MITCIAVRQQQYSHLERSSSSQTHKQSDSITVTMTLQQFAKKNEEPYRKATSTACACRHSIGGHSATVCARATVCDVTGQVNLTASRGIGVTVAVSYLALYSVHVCSCKSTVQKIRLYNLAMLLVSLRVCIYSSHTHKQDQTDNYT
jgi:hypothetical protein